MNIHRSRKKLWLPDPTQDYPAEADESGDEIAVSDAGGQLEPPGDDSELDALMREYELQAEKDLQSIQPPKPPPKMQERLKEGLGTKLEPSNKGFQLLKQMGYKEGKGLGRDGQGRVEPVQLNLKRNRTGLGRQPNPNKRKRQKGEPPNDGSKRGAVEVASFRSERSGHYRKQRMESQLKEIEGIIEHLDTQCGRARNHLWPKEDEANTEDDKGTESPNPDIDEIPLEDRFSEGLEYLRAVHHYCLWCGCKYDDAQDMDEGCPGELEADH